MNYEVGWHIANYRQAKYKRDQIEVIADLENCSLSDVVEMLRVNGVDVPEEYRYPFTPGCSNETALEIVHDRESEMTIEDIAKKHNLSEKIVSSVISAFAIRGGFSHLKMRVKKGRRRSVETLTAEQMEKIESYMNGEMRFLDVRAVARACKMSTASIYRVLREMYGEEYTEVRKINLKEKIYQSYGV